MGETLIFIDNGDNSMIGITGIAGISGVPASGTEICRGSIKISFFILMNRLG